MSHDGDAPAPARRRGRIPGLAGPVLVVGAASIVVAAFVPLAIVLVSTFIAGIAESGSSDFPAVPGGELLLALVLLGYGSGSGLLAVLAVRQLRRVWRGEPVSLAAHLVMYAGVLVLPGAWLVGFLGYWTLIGY